MLNLPNEMVIPMNAHHRSICRFRSQRDQGYGLVEAAIREIVFDEEYALSRCQQQARSYPLNAHSLLSIHIYPRQSIGVTEIDRYESS